MANLTSAINIQVDSETINLFLRQVIKTDGLPFEVKNPKPSKQLLKSLKEAEDIMNNPSKYKGYTDMDELKKALLSDD